MQLEKVFRRFLKGSGIEYRYINKDEVNISIDDSSD